MAGCGPSWAIGSSLIRPRAGGLVVDVTLRGTNFHSSSLSTLASKVRETVMHQFDAVVEGDVYHFGAVALPRERGQWSVFGRVSVIPVRINDKIGEPRPLRRNGLRKVIDNGG